MSRHYLFGPVNSRFVEEHLREQVDSGACLPFGDGTELSLALDDTWESFKARWPKHWEADLLVLYLQYATIPRWLWAAPVPIIGLAGDWNLLFHEYVKTGVRGEGSGVREAGEGVDECAAGCDRILTDAGGVEVFRRAGFGQARAACLYGLQSSFVDMQGGSVGRPATTQEESRAQRREGAKGKGVTPPAPPSQGGECWGSPAPLLSTSSRDIDILFVGNTHPAVQRERNPWLARLADRRNVFIAQSVWGDEYRQLLSRAKIVFNRSIRGEANMRTFEAAAAGALLFQEEENLEVRDFFEDGKECVLYRSDNLEELLNYYLDNDEEREKIAAGGREKVKEYTWAKLWEKQLGLIEREWPVIQERREKRQR
jgi:hypothetical protein